MSVAARRRPWTRLAADESGGVGIEFAIVSVALLLLSLGTFEFGRAFQMRGQLAFAADVAAREILKDGAAASSDVETKVRSRFHGPAPDRLLVSVGDMDADGFRTVSLSYPFTLLIPQLANGTLTLRASERVPVT